MKRRAVLTGAGTAGLVGIAGCLNRIGGSVRPDAAPEAGAADLACEHPDFERHNRGYSADELHWGDAAGFSLRVNDLSFDYGAIATITLTHSTVGLKVIGNRNKYNFEGYTDEGWQDVRGGDGRFAYTDEGFGKLTGQGWKWEIELTESGIADATSQDLTVCPDLESGRYRFVYWGLGGENAVAVGFDLRRDA